jgi:uncharacterized protein YndB with AHSA1/START domain
VAPIVSEVEIGRPPGEVYAYLTDPARFAEWQWGVVSARMVGDHQPAVGARFSTTTRIAGTEQTSTLEITDFRPPEEWAIRGVDGPVRVVAAFAVEPFDDGQASRVRITLDFEGHGPGRVLVPMLVRPQAAREAPMSLGRLKLRLEADG